MRPAIYGKPEAAPGGKVHWKLLVLRAVRIAVVFSLFAAMAVHAAPAPEPPQGQLDGSKSLFAVLAAINAAGYDADLNSASNHPLRQQLRQSIAARDLKSVRFLKQFFAAHRKPDARDELSQYITFALSVEGPPSFKWSYSTDRTPPAAAALAELIPLLADFWKEANLERDWQAAQPAYDSVIAKYHEPVTDALLQSNLYLRNATSGSRGRRFQIYVDLLGAPNQVHTREFTDDYFVVVTPTAQPRVKDIRRAYLHYLIDPLAMRSSEAIMKNKSLCYLAEGAPALSEIYKQDCVLLFGMSLVRAVESRLDHSPSEAAEAMSEGFVLTEYFADALVGYEKQEQSMRFNLPEMIENIHLKREKERIAAVRFLDRPVEHIVKAAPPPPSAAETPAELQLDEVDKLIRARDYEGSRAICRKVLQQPEPKPIHARAYFGLARIAALEKDPDLSKVLFEKTLNLDPEPFEKAWSHVYLARLATAGQEPAEAVAHYEAALAVPGGSEQARKSAQTELKAARSRMQQQ
jgi:tetratricopeptide (TPR) repeat protein